ncbi:hypothetical protein [Corynebacterium sp. ES2715-CONJ3]|uniref:hypothetical protein n=1 Tax=Corynebacterium sp. ES2715-CONJ3 TaxID=2974028 RepID=UPI0021689554|nr:hypothetical protein [Corynebacterium sp. ES2715-CONJ3]MCS4491550.1 hypothetical protein [Corynebacterium sp. ES2715-CONJ3]
MQLVRYGTTSDKRSSGCLCTGCDWETWFKRFESSRGRRIRTGGGAFLIEVVAAHKAGLVTVDRLDVTVPVSQKIGWLSSLVWRVQLLRLIGPILLRLVLSSMR